jgi:hypothetical protein
MEEFHLFYGGVFSQWYPCKFTINMIEYNCAEQYMMAMKASMFDWSMLDEIMASTQPRHQKELGRKIKNFNIELWNKYAKDIVFQGNLAKFGQNTNLRKLLKDTAPKTLVEASPYDKIWGIGLDAKDPRALSRNTWQGTNWLGETLTRVRDTLINHAED